MFASSRFLSKFAAILMVSLLLTLSSVPLGIYRAVLADEVGNADELPMLSIPEEEEEDGGNDQAEEDKVDEDDPLFNINDSTARSAYLLLKLKQYLLRAEQNFQSLQEKMDDTRSEIDVNRYTIDTLEGQITHLGDLVEETEDKIYNVELQIATKELDIKDSLEQIDFIEIEIGEQKQALGAYLKLLYFEQNLYYDQNNEANEIKILLQNGTVSEILQDSTYLSLMQQQAEGMVQDLESLERDLKKENYRLTFKRNELSDLRTTLEGEHRNLNAQLSGKENLLEETEGSDEIYRELFASYKLAQEAILDEINLFQTNISLLDQRIGSYAAYMSPEELALVEQIKSDAELGFDIQEAANFIDLDWPVSPELGLTAFYDDGDYIRTFGVAHHALDIRIPHGSIIYAPADGVVYLAQDTAQLEDSKARLGYGYFIVAHQKGVMTLYGHVSTILVQEGDFVHRGQMIGFTGGTPGTPGAGARTTGAHLHFEVLQDGVRVDPLEYLDLNEVPLDSLPDDYLRTLEAQLEASIHQATNELTELEANSSEDIKEWVQETIEMSTDQFEEFDDETIEDFWTQGENVPDE